METFIKKLSSITDKAAGICFFSVMSLVVVNVIMRKLFSTAIIGAYDLVGLLTATGIGLAQPQCTLGDGHIAVSILTDRLSTFWQNALSVIVNLVSLAVWLPICQRMFQLGISSYRAGRISSTAQFPVYPFIFIMAFGLLSLCLVLVSVLILSFKATDRRNAS
ncbi:MAG: TRAP transporter small permease [Oscillospiraceae bacterium]|nr:TRAP transporter small permease [Oscillospiraceae bacterium]